MCICYFCSLCSRILLLSSFFVTERKCVYTIIIIRKKEENNNNNNNKTKNEWCERNCTSSRFHYSAVVVRIFVLQFGFSFDLWNKKKEKGKALGDGKNINRHFRVLTIRRMIGCICLCFIEVYSSITRPNHYCWNSSGVIRAERRRRKIN